VADSGEARLLDLMPLHDPFSPGTDHRSLLRVVEGVRGSVTVRLRAVPRFDCGAVTPWLRDRGRGVITATGGQDGLLTVGLPQLALDGHEAVVMEATVRAGERIHLLLAYRRPERLDELADNCPSSASIISSATTAPDPCARTATRAHRRGASARLEQPQRPLQLHRHDAAFVQDPRDAP
jgi:hypothetical protein